MSSKILQWVGLVYVVATAPLVFTFISNLIKSAEVAQKNERELYGINLVIESDPSVYLYNRRADRKWRLGDYQGAVADFSRSIAINPSTTDAYAVSMRGYLKYRKLNDIQGALTDFNRAIEMNPYDNYAYMSRGLLKYQELKDRSGGLDDLKQADKMAGTRQMTDFACKINIYVATTGPDTEGCRTMRKQNSQTEQLADQLSK